MEPGPGSLSACPHDFLFGGSYKSSPEAFALIPQQTHRHSQPMKAHLPGAWESVTPVCRALVCLTDEQLKSCQPY